MFLLTRCQNCMDPHVSKLISSALSVNATRSKDFDTSTIDSEGEDTQTSGSESDDPKAMRGRSMGPLFQASQIGACEQSDTDHYGDVVASDECAPDIVAKLGRRSCAVLEAEGGVPSARGDWRSIGARLGIVLQACKADRVDIEDAQTDAESTNDFESDRSSIGYGFPEETSDVDSENPDCASDSDLVELASASIDVRGWSSVVARLSSVLQQATLDESDESVELFAYSRNVLLAHRSLSKRIAQGPPGLDFSPPPRPSLPVTVPV